MNKNLALARKSTTQRRFNGFRNRAAQVIAGVSAMAAAGAASATATLSSQAVTEINAQKPELLIIGGLILAVCGVIFMIKSGKRTTS